MKLSQLFTKTTKSNISDETSRGAQFLSRAGYVYKEMAGVYAYLPLGLRVLENIKQIIREEMNAIGGQEVNMTALQSKEIWEKSGRWESAKMDIWFKTELSSGGELGLAPTHEEPIAAMMKHFISSYKDLPQYPYQFQIKFRNELRARSGLMRCREFWMKDLYSLSTNKEQHDQFYDKVADAYAKIYDRLKIGNITFKTFASGGVFAKYSHEYQTISELGEDTVYQRADGLTINKEVFNDEVLKELGAKQDEFEQKRAIEVGNIFTLGTKYADAEGLKYTDETSQQQSVFMGSYGIGPSRVMGVLSEIFSTDKGLRWPINLAPFKIHLIGLGETGIKNANAFYEKMLQKGIEILFDDRENARFGEKMADFELIGCPLRVIFSDKLAETDPSSKTCEVLWNGLPDETPALLTENTSKHLTFEQICDIIET
ncbi:MAG: prolyl-tRNA synthetase [Candidatus Nomurabacteria bacterium]|jgi:prolyl-tRNA synthetase|nr:prolyl-tRNA synthetase [Candidatus Nomurabacteria bacterium]